MSSLFGSVVYSKFFNDKSISKNYAFEVFFDIKWDYLAYGDLVRYFLLDPYYVLDVTIPTYKFNKESINYGSTQYTFPTFASDQSMDLQITIEENRYGSIGKFIKLLENTVFENGVHKKIKEMKFGNIFIFQKDEQLNDIFIWQFKDVYFLGSESVNFTYDGNESLKHTITFGCDVVQCESVDNAEFSYYKTNFFSILNPVQLVSSFFGSGLPPKTPF